MGKWSKNARWTSGHRTYHIGASERLNALKSMGKGSLCGRKKPNSFMLGYDYDYNLNAFNMQKTFQDKPHGFNIYIQTGFH